jgi:hypothetical protein
VPPQISNLPTPLANYGAVRVGRNTTKALNPGIYTSIVIAGNAVVTMSPGTYIILGGGMVVAGNASVTGNGVTIFNAGSAYANDGVHPPTDGGTFGGITLTGNGSFSLTAPTSGPYNGVLIYQSRVNTRAIGIGGNATVNVNGTIYAANALLNLSGNGTLKDTLVVNSLNVSGNIALSQTAFGYNDSGDAVGVPGTLLAGDLPVYVNDPSGYFSAAMQSRISDAIANIDSLLVPYNVTITQVSDPSLALVTLDDGTTSASGTAAQGVLGSFNPSASPVEITILEGWDWYAGSDASGIGSGQYDFETVVMHELGHALGLGHRTDPNSVMFESLGTGVTRRGMTMADLNILEAPAGAEPQMAAGFEHDHSQDTSSPAALTVSSGAATVAMVTPTPNPTTATRPSYPTGASASAPAPMPAVAVSPVVIDAGVARNVFGIRPPSAKAASGHAQRFQFHGHAHATHVVDSHPHDSAAANLALRDHALEHIGMRRAGWQV